MTSFKQFIGFFAIVCLAAACKQPETTIVDEDPEASASGDTTEEAKSEAAFQQLNIGEHNPIRSLDPLFAENAATMRAVQLIYEGLVRFDEDGEVSPGLAYNWNVNDDSLSYEFNLRSQIFYHDSEVFSTGMGRRITSEDVQFVFERMARLNVPPHAAQLFMNIRGFDSYYQEQRFVYNPQNRGIESISGIETPDDSTVVFQLKKKDADFTRKLATPAAVIYPPEAVTGSSSISPVGSGPFTFSEIASDSTLVFSKFQDYYMADEIELNRIDIHVDASETSLGKSMDGGNIHLLPQLGPQLLVNLVDENGQLTSEHAGKYTLHNPGGAIRHVMRYNPNSDLPESDARQIAGYIKNDTTSYFEQFPGSFIQADTVTTAPEDTVSLQQEIYTTYSEDPYVKTFLGNLSTNLDEQGVSLQMMNIKAPTENTALVFTTDYPFLPNTQWSSFNKLFSFSVNHVALQQSGIEGISYNQYPWWFDLREATFSPTASVQP